MERSENRQKSFIPMKKTDELYPALKLLDKIIVRDIVQEQLGISDIIRKYKISIEEFNSIRDVLTEKGINKITRTYGFK